MPYKNELQIAYNQVRKSNHLFLPSINRPNALDTIGFSQFLAFRKAETDPNGTVLHDILSVETVSQALRTKRSGVRIPFSAPKADAKSVCFFLLVPVRAQPKGLPGRRPETHLRCIFSLWKALTHGRNCAIILFAH